MNINVSHIEIPRTPRNKRIYSGDVDISNTLTPGSGTGMIYTTDDVPEGTVYDRLYVSTPQKSVLQILEQFGFSIPETGTLLFTGNFAATGEVQAWSDDGTGLPQSLLDALPIATSTSLGIMQAGSGLSVTNGVVDVVGGGTSAIWGQITGYLPDQTDLQDALDLKYDAANFNTDYDTRLATKTTDDLAEGATNLYYTEARVAANPAVAANTAKVSDIDHFAGKKTDDLPEGSTNLYFVASRVNTLYQPDGTNPFVYTDNSGVLHIDGDIVQNGSAYETHAEQVYTTKDYIILRDGATAGLANGAYAGFTAKLYDGVNDGHLVFDNQGVARVGDVGLEQPLTTREESPTDKTIQIWDAPNYRLKSLAHGTGFLKNDGAGGWSYDNTSYQPAGSYAPASGSANYIQNQNSSAQVANMWIDGEAKAGNVIAYNSAGNGSYFGLFKNVGSLPGYASSYYPTLKTDFSYMYFSVGGNYSAFLGGADVEFGLKNIDGVEAVHLRTNGTSWFNGGNLLIGTTTTDNGTDKLQVAGSGSFSGNLTIAGTTKMKQRVELQDADGNLAWIITVESDGTLNFRDTDYDTIYAKLDKDGNLSGAGEVTAYANL